MDDVLVVVPARGGSKRICNKNIKNIGGWPMISWPLRQLSTLFKSGRVVVSTDSQKIVDLVKKYNLDVPFIRPEELSGDYVGTMPVVSHALSWYERYVQKVKYILIVYPTAVILDYTNILKAYEIITNNSLCGCVFSAAHFAAPIQRAFYEKNGFASMISPEYLSVRSQDLEESFYDAGQFYLFRSECVRQQKNLLDSNPIMLKLPRYEVIDIDTHEDFIFAEFVLNSRMKEKNISEFQFES